MTEWDHLLACPDCDGEPNPEGRGWDGDGDPCTHPCHDILPEEDEANEQ